MNRKATIVMYHYVRSVHNSIIGGLKVLDVDNFYSQLKFLNKEYDIIDHIDFHNFLFLNQKLPSKPMLLTFDDGYLDNYRYVFPVLQELNLKASFYIPNYFENRKLLDVNAIQILLTKEDQHEEYILFIKNYMKNNLSDLKYENILSEISFNSRFDSDIVVIIKKLLQHILPEINRKEIISKLLEKYFDYDMEKLFEEFYCNKMQINLMIKSGMHVGGHGVRHYWLNNLNLDDQIKEIEGSLLFLNSLHTQPFYSFCYPFGGYNAITIDLLKKYGFKYSFTTRVGDFTLDKSNRYEIPRFDTNDFPISFNYYK